MDMRSTSRKKKRKKKSSLRARVMGVVVVLGGAGILVFGVGLSAIWLLQQVWNGFVPAAFGGSALTFGETACGFVLAIVVVLVLSPVKR